MHSLLPSGNKIIPSLLTPLNVLIMIVTIILTCRNIPYVCACDGLKLFLV